MCGFAGFTGPTRPQVLTQMGERILHRGPDQHGRFEGEGVSFVHARLSIIDLSEAGKQPMQTADGRYTIVYNGELYNYRELRERYRREGYVFRTETDTEVFLASAALHELSDLQDMHGMFAFVIWDRREKRLWAARDRMGIKPLYVARRDGDIAFASEIKGLLPWTGPCHEDLEARALYLALGSVPGPRTIFAGVESLEPGVVLSFQEGEERCIPFVSSRGLPPFTGSRDEACRQLRSYVDEAVRSQLIGDRPIGLFLSGGWDSSVIAEAVRRAEPSASLKAFTVRFAHEVDDPKFNQDAEIAKKTAETFAFEHHEVVLGAQDVIESAEAISWSLDQPMANHSVHALNKVSASACEHVPVVLSGDGGDESFGGYPRYALAERLAMWMRLPYVIRRALVRAGSVSSWVASHRDALTAPTLASVFASFHAPSSDRLRAWFPGVQDPFASASQLMEGLLLKMDHGSPRNVAAAFMELDRQLWLRDDAFVRADRVTMRHGLEGRVPLTDDRLVDFAASLPSSFHVAGGQNKLLWRLAFADRVHEEVRRLPKRGWFPPTAKWLRTGLREWSHEIIEDALVTHAWMDADAIRRAYDDHLAKRGYYLNELWTVIGYHLWWRAYRNDLRV